MKYSLWKEDGTVGDAGMMCEILDSESYKPIPGERYPKVGCGVRVGSHYGRTYSAQDWWQTSPILEILEETVDDEGYRFVKFRTKNSVYCWREF